MNEKKWFSYPIYEEETHLAERELAAFIMAVTERLGLEQAGTATADWLDESDLTDTRPSRSVETGIQFRLQLQRVCQIKPISRSIVRLLCQPLPIRKYRLYHRSVVSLPLLCCDADSRARQH
jgi:hypothetical protein